MHGASEQILQISLQGGLLEETWSVTHVNEHVEIAPWPSVTAGD